MNASLFPFPQGSESTEVDLVDLFPTFQPSIIIHDDAAYLDAELRFWGTEIDPHECSVAMCELEAFELNSAGFPWWEICPETQSLWDALQHEVDEQAKAEKNATRFLPELHESLFMRLILTGKNTANRHIYFGCSPEDYLWLSQNNWNINFDKSGKRYPRRKATKADVAAGIAKKIGQTIYPYREIMRRMLLENDAFRAKMLRQFGLCQYKCPYTAASMLLKRCDVHHRNHNPEDCRRENLELATRRDNTLQRELSPGRSGFVGVKTDDGKSYQAYITIPVLEADMLQFNLLQPPPTKKSKKRKPRFKSTQWRVEGNYEKAEHAALARTVCLLANPDWMPPTFTPASADEYLWQAAQAFAQGVTEHHHFGHISELPPKLRNLIEQAKLQAKIGTLTNVLPRC